MLVHGRRVAKHTTEERIAAALPPGWRLLKVNWKKGGKIHIVNGFGQRKVLPFPAT